MNPKLPLDEHIYGPNHQSISNQCVPAFVQSYSQSQARLKFNKPGIQADRILTTVSRSNSKFRPPHEGFHQATSYYKLIIGYRCQQEFYRQ